MFASLAAKGPSFEDHIGPMKGNIDDLVDRAPDGTLALDVGMHRYAYNGNWKLQVENVLDSYHVPFGHASTVNKQGVQFARREGDQKGAAVVETEKKQTAASWKDRKSYIAGNGHGWTSNTTLDDGKRSSPAFDEYKRVLAEKVGAERAQQILTPRLHNSLIYPNMSIMGLNIHVRVIKPIAVDRTEVTIYPDSPRRCAGGDEFRQYPPAQRHAFGGLVRADRRSRILRARAEGAAQPRHRLGRHLARAGRRGARPRAQCHARAGHPRDGRARAIQGLARLYARGGMMDAPARAPASPGSAGVDRAPIEQFLIHEARLLDSRRFREWMGLFAEDGTYWVPAVPDQESPFDQASLFYDDRDLMRTRVERLEHPRIHVQTPPSRTAHLVGNVLVEEADEAKGEYVVGSTVIMVEYRDDAQRVFAGQQRHRLRRDGASFRIVQKRVDLINCDSAFEAMAVPI